MIGDNLIPLLTVLYIRKHKHRNRGKTSLKKWVRFVKPLNDTRFILFMRYVHSTMLSEAYWKPIEIYCWNSLHQGRSVPRCWYMKLLLPLLKVKYYTRWHKLTILSIHTFNKFNSSPILRKSWGWHRIPWTIFNPLFIYE